MMRPPRVLAALLLLVAALTACQNDSWVLRGYSAGWSGARADARNSGYADHEVPEQLVTLWSRPLLGDTFSQPSISSRGFVGVTALTGLGCNLFSFNLADSRKRWCLRRYFGAELATPLVDQFDTTYLGQAGLIAAFAQNDSVKWSRPVLGAALSSVFTSDGNLLVVTHLGQVEVLNPVNGLVVSPPVELLQVADRRDGAQGLADCAKHGPACPVAYPPAYDPASGRFVLSLWRPGQSGAELVGLRYDSAGKGLAVDWRAQAADPGPTGMPVVDSGTVYQQGGAGTLAAYRLADGAKLWSTPAGPSGAGVLAVAPGGTVVLGGGAAEPQALAAYTDKGPLWKRDDLRCLSPATLAAGGSGFVLVAGASGKGSAVVRFDVTTGATRGVTELPDLPPSRSPGISVAATGELVFASGGELVALGPHPR